MPRAPGHSLGRCSVLSACGTAGLVLDLNEVSQYRTNGAQNRILKVGTSES